MARARRGVVLAIRRDAIAGPPHKRAMGSSAAKAVPLSPAPRSPVSYASWIARQFPESEAPTEKTRVLERPTADLFAQVAQDRDDRVECFVTGFLPDEIEWTGDDSDGCAAYLHWRLEFRPFLLPGVETSHGAAEILLVCDDSVSPASGSESWLAEALAAAEGVGCVTMVAGAQADETVAEAIARARLVVNAVTDWSYGFAVDVAAALAGRPVVRLRNPGYSPLRHALLGQSLVITPEEEIPRLRSAIPATVDESARQSAREWFIDGGAPGRWRSLATSPVMGAYWSGVNWAQTDTNPKALVGDWCCRPAAWAFLAAAQAKGEFPRAAAARAMTIMTGWLHASIRCRPVSRVREWGLGRWLVRHPDWVEIFRKAGGDISERRKSLLRWCRRGLDVVPVGGEVLPSVRAVAWAVEREPDEAADLRRVLTWLGTEPAAAATNDDGEQAITPPGVRAACAEAAWARMNANEADRCDAAELEGAGKTAAWRADLGAAAPVLRALVAWRGRRPGLATAELRELRQALGVRLDGGLARVVRAAFPPTVDFKPWLRGVAMATPATAGATVTGVLQAWMTARSAALWRRYPEPEPRTELATALRWIQAVFAVEPRRTDAAILRAILLALDGDGEATVSAWRAVSRSAPSLLPLLALALWLREQPDGGRLLMEQGPLVRSEAAMPLFLRACAMHLLEMTDAATVAAKELADRFPGLLADQRIADARWCWTALVLKRAGRVEEAARFAALAQTLTRTAPEFFVPIEPGTVPLAEGWLRLLGH